MSDSITRYSDSTLIAWGQPKSLYANIDRRRNIYTLDKTDPFENSVADQAQSVAFMIKKLQTDGSGDFLLETVTLAKYVEAITKKNFGEAELFREEPVPIRGVGTAFLIAPRLALTARHCVCRAKTAILDKEEIENTHLVFGFLLENAQQKNFKIEKKNAYKFKVVNHSDMSADWALLKLDRDVEGRVPLATNFLANTVLKTELYMLGHPSGLPMKFTYGAEIKNNANQYFGADLDAFGGNSGSPVLDRTHQYVIGILVCGKKDYDETKNYQNTGNIRSYAYHVSNSDIAATGYEGIQKLNRMKFVRKYMRAQQDDLDAQCDIGIFYLTGKGVKKSIEKGMKWLKKAADQGHTRSQEKIAQFVLELKSKGRASENSYKAVSIVGGTFITVLTLPIMFGFPGIQSMKNDLKKIKSQRFTFLAEDDPRFKIFVYLEKNKIEHANKELEQHKPFFLELAKTQTFLKKFKTMLSHCTEAQRRVYLDYFKSHGIVSQNFYAGPSTDWADVLLPTTDSTRESDNEDDDRVWSD